MEKKAPWNNFMWDDESGKMQLGYLIKLSASFPVLSNQSKNYFYTNWVEGVELTTEPSLVSFLWQLLFNFVH